MHYALVNKWIALLYTFNCTYSVGLFDVISLLFITMTIKK